MSWSPPLASQRSVKKKKTFFGRKKTRNTYRQRKVSGKNRKNFWGKLLLVKIALISLTGLCLGLVALYYQLLTSDFFSIKNIGDIEITGTDRLDPALLLQMTGLGPGVSLLALRPARVEQALRAHPWIAEAELTRRWPNRVHLAIQERKPVALVQVGEIYYADRKGSLFKPLSPGDPHDFPIITGLKRELFVEGQGFPPVIFEKAMALIDLLKDTPAPLNLSNISEIHVDQERGFTLYANGMKSAVHLGLNDLPEKLQKFALVWPTLRQQGPQVEFINLDYPQRVLLSMKELHGEPVGRAQ
ncbi:MAG: FtsQ-type POTRA domain-containing protein [Deltaproteobacteria bacterium]|nr:FtsQ-type POTRA domain-containing protein [Deltaproteobacteria bacterium]